MITNTTDIPLSLAIWLLNDTYDHDPDLNTISVTTLIKPIRNIVLGRAIPSDKDIDLNDLVPSKLGTAVHESVEKAWKTNALGAMAKLGISKKVMDRLIINPVGLKKGDLPVYLEHRSKKKMGKFTVSGKFDFVIEGKLEDLKSTSVWGWIFQSSVDSYIKQGSIYRYLNQDIITDDHMRITYLFTDWSASKAKQDKTYPQSRIKTQDLELMSIPATELFIQGILDKIELLEQPGTIILPQCTKEELWQSDPVWKYYKDPNKRIRSTKNFDNATDANTRLVTDGHVGIVVKIPGEVKRCIYCNASPICTQREQLELSGALKY